MGKKEPHRPSVILADLMMAGNYPKPFSRFSNKIWKLLRATGSGLKLSASRLRIRLPGSNDNYQANCN